ncbi:MAG: hypothetical protein PHD12_10035 [Methylotenera sp.]|nr:hypothetical protein [Methylotenera sp.]
MKLTVDVEITRSLLAEAEHSALAYLLSKARKVWQAQSLERLVCGQFGLTPQPDYPVAAMAAHMDGLAVGHDYWLHATPVHLVMQRDSLSLSEDVPLLLSHAHAMRVIESLNQHFSADGLTFILGSSGAWYVRLAHSPQIKTAFASEAIGRNVFACLPQGDEAQTWRAYLNEIQMLLHTHPVNAEREASNQTLVNSLWLSGGGVFPALQKKPAHGVDLVLTDDIFYQGLAAWSGVPFHAVNGRWADALDGAAEAKRVRIGLGAGQLQQPVFAAICQGLKRNKIKKLTLNLGCYDRTMLAELNYWDTLKFWQATKPVPQIIC